MISKFCILTFSLLLLMPLEGAPQRPAAAPPPPAEAVVSPEVHADRRVTFRLRAPGAQQVNLQGDFGGGPRAMTKDAQGVWSLTFDPLEPDMYSYTFSVDGASFIDPANPRLKTGVRSTQSMAEVRGEPPAVWEERPVPHGLLHIHTYQSKALGDTRRFYVYTPPNYDKDQRARYPVLYLLHGSGDDERNWTSTGRAHLILDNLLAENRVKPMLVVMPFGHALSAFAPRTPEARWENIKKFESDLLNDVLPAVESRYRAHRDRQHRAIAGLSMGGGQALTIGLNRLDLFAWVGGFSSAIPSEALNERLPALVADPKGANEKLRLLWIGCGQEDRLFSASQGFSASLKQKKIRHEFRATPGAHTWRVWRRYLAELAPLLFGQTT